jgi:hypothetical protein
LAREAKVDLLQIRIYEQTRGQSHAEVLSLLRSAIETAGMIFVEKTDEGPGVRLRNGEP